MLDLLGKSLLLPSWGWCFDVLESLKMVLDVLDPLGMVFDVLDRGKRLLLPLPLIEESFDNFMLNCGNLEMSLPF